MNYYEKIVILDPNLDDSGASEAIKRITDVITKQGGEILKTDNWGRRKLAYELNKHSNGNYVLLLFKAPSATILELEKLCKLIDTIIKFMVVRLVKKKQIEAALATVTAAAEAKDAGEAKPAEAKPASEATTAGDQPEQADSDAAAPEEK